MHLLDTNVVSELRKVRSGKADPNVTAWAAAIPAAQLFISVISLHELEHGVLSVERHDPSQGAVLRQWLDVSVARAFAGRVLPVDECHRAPGSRTARSRSGTVPGRPHRGHRAGPWPGDGDSERQGLRALSGTAGRRSVALTG